MNLSVWIFFFALLIAYASAGIVPKEEYLPPVGEEEQLAAEQPLDESAALAEDGYRYKTVRKLRHRRDVAELFAQGTLADDGYHYHTPKSDEPLSKLSQEYLPPVEEATENKEVISEAPKVSNEYLPPPAEEKTQKKDATAAPEISREYLPPTEAAATLDVPKFAASEELPSLLDDDAVIIEGPSESSVLGDDGYHYRRIRYRRDVSEIVPSAGYSYEAPVDSEEIIAAAEIKESIPEPSEDEEIVKEYLPPVVAEVKETAETAELADDGYRYKTVRKLKYRQRRDVSEIFPATPAEQEEESTSESGVEYLPPIVAEVKEASEIPSETAELAEDGYRYKKIQKLKYRQRRDVSEIVIPESATLDKNGYHYRIPEPTQIIPKVSNEYLPPSPAKLRELSEDPKEIVSTEAPAVVTESTSMIPESTTTAVTEAPSTTVSETTVTRVTESPSTTPIPVISNEYLPPSEEVPLVKALSEVSSTTTAAPPAVVSNQYLPPAEEVAETKEASEMPKETAVLADDGYHYKVGKRFRFRRDVSEIVDPKNGYSYEAPAATNEAANIYLPPVEVKETAETYEASQIASEYLPPGGEESKNDAEIIDGPEESALLADDGYRYKTVRRLKYRTRRDVSEITDSNGYLYPTPAPEEESAVLADDGYRYKTVRRLKYRHRRDVSELVAPVEESAVFAEDGYHYKVPSTAATKVANEYLPPVKDVAEFKEALNIEPTIAPEVSNEYLPPAEAAPKEAPSSVVSNEYLPPTEIFSGSAELVDIPQVSAILADDGYHYKTVRRIRYRHRRDVSELANQQAEGYNYNAPIEVEQQEIQYLPPPVEEVAQVKEAADTATLADDGYRYKTVRRIRYRHRV